MPLFRGHKGPVLDTAFNPFNEQQVVSCSDDGKILLWDIPKDYSFHKYVDENDNIKDMTEPTRVLSGHTKKVGHVEFHPCAENVLASCSMDYTVKIWNTETGKVELTLPHRDLVTSFAFNYNGSLLVTTSRDKKLRIWDIRSGKVISEGNGHTGAKPSRVVWLGNTDRIITTGFSKMSDRQVGVWDVNDIGKGPIGGFLVIDSSSGVLIPVFDESNSILYIAGKGDGNIRYYEYENDVLYELSQYSSVDPQRGFTVAPKSTVNVKENEILKSFKTVNDLSIEPVSFIVPRRSELFQDDIYPDAPSSKAAISAEDWFAGKEVNGPLLLSMESVFNGTESSLKESSAGVKITENKAKEDDSAAKEVAEKEKKKDLERVAAKEREIAEKNVAASSGNVDDVLKSSDKVNTLLSKVNDASDDEDTHFLSGGKEDDWEEIKKPSPEKEEKKKEEKKVEPKAEKVEAKAEKVATKAEAKLVEKEASPAAGKTGAPTLKATVEKLAGLVDHLEGQVSKLTAASLEKDDRLAALEKKIDEWLRR